MLRRIHYMFRTLYPITGTIPYYYTAYGRSRKKRLSSHGHVFEKLCSKEYSCHISPKYRFRGTIVGWHWGF